MLLSSTATRVQAEPGSFVLQGIQSVGVPVDSVRSLTRLWAHEALRVYHDRLVSEEDRSWFCKLLHGMVVKHMGIAFEDAFPLPAPASEASGAQDEVGVATGLSTVHDHVLNATWQLLTGFCQ